MDSCFGLQQKAAELHAQLHGSTFHMKLAKEAMKKVREIEQQAAAKAQEGPPGTAGPFSLSVPLISVYCTVEAASLILLIV